MRFRSLASGSAGNATLIEGLQAPGADAAPAPFRVLVDCGMNAKQLRQRLQGEGLQMADLDAIFVTHEHSDHVGAAFDVARQWQIPVWSSHGTWLAAGAPDTAGMWQLARDGQPLRWGQMEALPFTVPHDAREPLQLRISQQDVHIAIVTDLGHVTGHVAEHAAHCHALLLEFNHDREMLLQSRYPAFLKRRISGRLGHLANEVAAELLQQVLHDDLQYVVAAHLSQQNNRPEHALHWMRHAVQQAPVELLVASQEGGSGWIEPGAVAPSVSSLAA
ncbi:MBL fold metallo-hydrolase [Corticibacter populi]|uniref:MBL fold metallo-hydrolase n=1 Tax=Corticibacter populi TaxID=1550736 RepID=A0A3M6QHQ0_9BURK|nr:MBL fold metallo-hydrolase [Corticibacter populi]